MTRIPNQHKPGQRGFTLVELMIAMVLGLLVVLAATAMLLSSRSTYLTQDQGTRIAENGRFALSLITHATRLAGYSNFGSGPMDPPPLYSAAFASQNVSGVNSVSGAPNSSDSLTIRFYGSGTTAVGDGTMLDCLGQPVADAADPDINRSSNRFYVATNASTNQPELYCDTGSGGQPLISGVESFQVLYAVPFYGPGVDPDINPYTKLVYKRADQMHNPDTNAGYNDWNLTQYVRVAMLLRSETGARGDLDSTTYNLFGSDYAAMNAAADPGTTINASALTNIERTRLRRVVSTTIMLYNNVNAWPTN